MNTNTKNLILALMLSPITANASVVLDVQKKMSALLGHDPAVVNAFEAEKERLNEGSAKFQPWAGSFWPDINGGITNHYRDHGALGAKLNFLTRYEMAKGRMRGDHKDVCEKFGAWDIKQLSKKMSPSEKYDLLLGNPNFEFTKAIMEEMDFRSDYRLTTKKADGSESESDASSGSDSSFFEDDVDTYGRFDNKMQFRYWRKKPGSLSYWSGICDGWSPASIYLPRPAKPVTVRAANGQWVTFYPDDIKALGSYLFARTNTPLQQTMNYTMAGRKCDESGSPKLDDKGFVKDIRCNDLDAGIWHLSLLNRIGKDRMGFIFDIDNNLKINNHPIADYKIEYFNLKTGLKVNSLKDAVVQRWEVQDGYARRRNQNTKYLVGVKSKINFMYYYWPEENRDEQFDSVGKDNNKKRKKDKEFVYDLELDDQGNILGGEWGNRFEDTAAREAAKGSNQPMKHVQYAEQPDFIWMAAPNKIATSEMSEYAYPGAKLDLNNPRPFGNMQWAWDGKSKLPSDWVEAARADMTWKRPESVEDKDELEAHPEAKNSQLKYPQPLSHIVYYLFDQSRDPAQK